MIKTKETNSSAFQWSLKPLFLLGNMIGVPINVSISNTRKSLISAIRFLVIASFCCFVLVANLVNNGTKLINFKNLKIQSGNTDAFESPFIYFLANPQGLIVFVKDLMAKWFFASVPLVHLIFLISVMFSNNWADFFATLNKVQTNMKLGTKFHIKCRNHCLSAILLLILV